MLSPQQNVIFLDDNFEYISLFENTTILIPSMGAPVFKWVPETWPHDWLPG